MLRDLDAGTPAEESSAPSCAINSFDSDPVLLDDVLRFEGLLPLLSLG